MDPFETVDDPGFAALRNELTAYPRMHGYYLVDLVSIRSLRESGRTQEEILDAVFEHFDDSAWAPPEQRPAGVHWEDQETDASRAEEVTVRALIGGGQVGHTRDTIPPPVARSMWGRFDDCFESPRRYYVGMGLGRSDYVYLHGAAIVDDTRAGILWVVESD